MGSPRRRAPCREEPGRASIPVRLSWTDPVEARSAPDTGETVFPDRPGSSRTPVPFLRGSSPSTAAGTWPPRPLRLPAILVGARGWDQEKGEHCAGRIGVTARRGGAADQLIRPPRRALVRAADLEWTCSFS